MNFIARQSDFASEVPISTVHELGAYEALWLEPGASFKRIAERFAADPNALPSDFVEPGVALDCAKKVITRFVEAGIEQFGVRVNHAGDYPKKLRDARHPIEVLYFQGMWELSELPSVAVVGSRKPSDDGLTRAAYIAQQLAKNDFVVVSGLATGIDTAAHHGALSVDGRTIAVVGTPLDSIYPKENSELQHLIAEDHLLISQVPVLRYHQQDYRKNRLFFPERNATMSALTDATVIVEAGETSGTLTQARAALYQGRKLFILDSCFTNPNLTWPARFEREGAVRVTNMDHMLELLSATVQQDR